MMKSALDTEQSDFEVFKGLLRADAAPSQARHLLLRKSLEWDQQGSGLRNDEADRINTDEV